MILVCIMEKIPAIILKKSYAVIAVKADPILGQSHDLK